MLRLAWIDERNLESDLEKARLRFEKYLCELEEGNEMEVIYKFELSLCDYQFVSMPIGSRILCVKEQNGAM